MGKIIHKNFRFLALTILAWDCFEYFGRLLGTQIIKYDGVERTAPAPVLFNIDTK